MDALAGYGSDDSLIIGIGGSTIAATSKHNKHSRDFYTILITMNPVKMKHTKQSQTVVCQEERIENANGAGTRMLVQRQPTTTSHLHQPLQTSH